MFVYRSSVLFLRVICKHFLSREATGEKVATCLIFLLFYLRISPSKPPRRRRICRCFSYAVPRDPDQTRKDDEIHSKFKLIIKVKSEKIREVCMKWPRVCVSQS